jgi:tetratricopeptide (TPR) repeat protein
MQWLWSFNHLAKVCRYKNTDSERLLWSIERLGTLYPEQAADVLLEVIGKGDEKAAEEALIFFENHQDKKYSQSLRDLYMKSSGSTAGLIAGVLAKRQDLETFTLFKDKFPGSIEENAKKDLKGYIYSLVFLSKLKTDEIREEVQGLLKNQSNGKISVISAIIEANLIVGVPIIELLEHYLDKPDTHTHYFHFLEAIGEYCQTELISDSFTSLEKIITSIKEDDENSVIMESFIKIIDIIQYSNLWHKKNSLLTLFKKQKYEKIVTLIQEGIDTLIADKKKALGEDNYARWESTAQGITKNNLDAIKSIAHIFPRLPDNVKANFAYGIVCLFTNIVSLQPVIGIVVEEKTIIERWSIFLENRRSIPIDNKSFELFKSTDDIDQKVEDCFQVLENNPNGMFCFRIVGFLGSFRKQEYFERLLRIAFEDQDVWDKISSDILKLDPQIALNLTSSYLENKDTNLDPVHCALSVLSDLPMESTVQLLLKYWEWLYSLDQNYFLMVLSNIADKRFLIPLKKETKEYCELEWETYSLICRVNGKKDPWIKNFGKKLKEFHRNKFRIANLLKDNKLEEFLKEPLFLDLECRHCTRIYTYKVYKVHVVPETMDIFIQDTILCKHCEAYDHYRLTPMVSVVILPMMGVYMETVTEFTDLDQLVISPMTSALHDGTHISQQEMLDLYQNNLAEDPQNPELLIGYANALKSVKRAEDAPHYFKKALEYDQYSIEAYLGLGQIEEHKGHFHKAYDHYWKVADNIHSGNLYRITQGIDDFKINFAHLFSYIADSINKPLHPDIVDIMNAHHMH